MQTISLLIDRAYAVNVGLCIPNASGCKSSFANFGAYIMAILEFAKRVGTVVVILSIIYGGYVYLTSQGDSAKLNTAKDRVGGAILGYILLLLIGAILHYIGIDSP